MIRQVEIEGFKSIDTLRFKLGRVTVLIGENGCGKSNILEALAMASAADGHRLDHEFLDTRGVRLVPADAMKPAFPESSATRTCVAMLDARGRSVAYPIAPAKDSGLSDWVRLVPVDLPSWNELAERLQVELVTGPAIEQRALAEAIAWAIQPAGRGIRLTASDGASPIQMLGQLIESWKAANPLIGSFLIYAPEESALRVFEGPRQILPLGRRGEGLFAHLKALRASHPDVLRVIAGSMRLIDWFDGFEIPNDLGPGEHRLDIRDRYLDPLVQLDQRSANEGFLFLLFYFTLLISPETPRFFAVDNIDASLNPRLCARLMQEVVRLAEAHDRQIIVTTHNPAILDGLDLTDDEQRLLVVSRRPNGPTRVRRVKAPKPVDGAPPMRLSEAFIGGYLGGLPTSF